MRARTRWPRRHWASALAALLGGCVAAEDLELPPAPAGTRAGVVVATLPDASGRDRVLGAQGFELGTPTVWALPHGAAFALLYYDRALAELGLEHGPLRMALQNERTRPLPEPRLAFARAADGARDWAPLAAEDRPAVSLPDFLAEDCVARGGCIDEDDDEKTRCVVPCPEPEPVALPIAPTPITPPDEMSCPTGWSRSAPSYFGGTSCVPDAIGLDCSEGQYLALGLGSCAPLGRTCPPSSDPFGPDPEPMRRTFYVEAGRTSGSGTRDAPFANIDDALRVAGSGDRILFSTGEHMLGTRAITGLRDVELRGACAAGTVLRGSLTLDRSTEIEVRELHVIATSTRAAVLLSGSGAELEHVHLTGVRAALAIGGPSTATLARALVDDLDQEVDLAQSTLDLSGRARLALDDVEVRAPHRRGVYAGARALVVVRGLAVRDAGSTAVTVFQGATVTGAGLFVERARGDGLEITGGANADLEHVMMQDVSSSATEAALRVTSGSHAYVRGARFERSGGRNVAVAAASDLVLERAIVLDDLSDSPYGSVGAGGSHLTIHRVLIEGYAATGLFGDHATIDGDDLGVWPGAPRTDKQDGIYLFASDATLTRVRIDGARGRAINHTTTIDPPVGGRLLPATAVFSDVDIRDTVLDEHAEGFGIYTNRSATVAVSRATIVRSESTALGISDSGTRGTFEDVDIRGAALVALHARDAVHVVGSRVSIDDVRGLGLWISTDTLEEPEVAISDFTVARIDGPAAVSTLGASRALLSRFSIIDVNGTAIEVLDPGLALEGGEIDRALVGLSVPASYDIATVESLLRRVRFGAGVRKSIERP